MCPIILAAPDVWVGAYLTMFDSIRRFLLPAAVPVLLCLADRSTGAAEPPAINPFGRRPAPVREDAIPGYVELSDGAVHPGNIYLTRDKRLKIFDPTLQRQREVPLRVIKQIECNVKRQWMEKEWKFKELALDEKMYTGRTYPTVEYLHTITLHDDRTITGPLSAIVYVRPYIYTPKGPNVYRPQVKPEKFLLNKRNKGKIGEKPNSLVYVKLIKLGEEALAEGRKKAAAQRAKSR